MKHLTVTLSLLLWLPAFLLAGNSVTFVINDLNIDDEKVLVYPAGTTYKVLGENGQPIPPAQQDKGALAYEARNFQLLVYPSYRPDKADEYSFADKRLRVFETPRDAKRQGYAKNWQEGEIVLNHGEDNKYVSRPYGVETAYEKSAQLQKKIVLASEERPGQYNLKLYFKNGVEFHYQDGEATASLNGKPLIVEGKYIVHSDMGTAKISFNPETGKTWWVFTKEKETTTE